MERAACRGRAVAPQGDVFFAPDTEETGGDREAAARDAARRERAAIAICERCPTRRECLEYALATGQTYGVWGGCTERQLRRLVERAGPRPPQPQVDHGTRGRRFGSGVRPTHCPAGHPYDEANTYLTNAGRRQCQTCRRARARAQQRDLAARRTHCPRGHPYDQANTGADALGRRKCLVCARAKSEAETRWYAQQRARAAAARPA
jgi:hypothetical protein